MLAKRIIPCLDVKNGQVVKGIQFKEHVFVGDILSLAKYYVAQQADELVFYDITASAEDRSVALNWVRDVAAVLDIPFCVAGGIRTLQRAEAILNAGADKISINSPALENPGFINVLVKEFGSQCIVIGIDSLKVDDEYYVCQYTGDVNKSRVTNWKTKNWAQEVQARGAGEIVLNCMDQDGVQSGYDIAQLDSVRSAINVPLIASGGAGNVSHFVDVFKKTGVNGALAASVFHCGKIDIPILKTRLATEGIEVR